MTDPIEEIRVELERWKRVGCDRHQTVLRYQMAMAAMTTLLAEIDRLREAAMILCTNAELAPDPRMNGTTDCFLVPLDDVEALAKALKGGG